MAERNETAVSEFILVGFSSLGEKLKIFLFLVLLLIYLITITGNVVIIFVVWVNPRLHSAMYFFIANLSFLETWFTSVTSPKLMLNFLSISRTISFHGCMAQSFFYFALGGTELAFLVVMSFDRYVAICRPLQYATVMEQRFCIQLVLGTWVGGFMLMSLRMLLFSKLSFCGPNVINHFFCDNTPLFLLSCSDTSRVRRVDSILISILVLSSLGLTMLSYVSILFSILRIPTATGRQKAFATCGSHLTSLAIAYGSCIVLYARPSGSSSLDVNKGVALLNTVLYPFLNPFIYSLRNKTVKLALREMFRLGTEKLLPDL
ncbi:olfactory receptor 6M1-like isoform X2 [Chelonia mydas]|uniref:olfactory receptor 6M1-like isoform X2 n=1 Tax=Chelonia mydas TaxID=8469 RepID=UPI001CA7C9AE|nr:olfactory receptor 6M1-like isoform X2 [Chelonia mydas]XP_043383172.1 olfactory receptor 6M1-like isoform X2 [Chelonia mydas]